MANPILQNMAKKDKVILRECNASILKQAIQVWRPGKF